MKKTLFFLAMLSASLQFNAQTVIFEETFESTEEGFLPDGWVAADRDEQDGARWLVRDIPGMGAGMTEKFVAVGSMSAVGDHLLILPELNLSQGSAYSLTYQIGIRGGTSNAPDPAENHYALYVLPATATFTGQETPILEETVNSSSNVHLRTVNLSAYASQDVKIYFRQFNGPSSYGSLLMLDDVQIMEQAVLGTSEVKKESTVGIYPNPASDYVYLKSKSKITHAEVYDITGRKINVRVENERLDVRDLQPGTYIITTESENKKSSHKLIKK
ncbi:MAG: T9SS type A sorting domain-containing protein [Chryseobacterium sp.]|jgi:hypothetical protein|uniref:T9SS-dependent choice-of-anchor J family protein n=1 Tax=Chryseobacterium sp. TaxID=1871047 RepID=UPI00282A4AEF|nr:T9SS type A sorting domain-containing protein [Chryseobacterium sp.]MDR2237007.1 T9SS type A sorting domain-containing protein [Chryseobacterium sp.]